MSSSTSPAFNIYRDQRNKCEIYRYPRNKVEDDVWDGEIDEPAPPPYVVLVQGPPNVGKSLLIKSLVKHFTMEHIMNDIQGPITIPTVCRVPDDINGMIDAAKYADLVLLLVDASYGFEAETFEFFNLLRVHGLPKVMGVLTHLDQLEGENGNHRAYKMLEVQKLAQAISMLRFHTPSWRAKHPYVHMAGVGDFRLASVTSLVDPFPLASEMEDEENLVDITHMDMGSFRTGTYLRLEVHDVPYRMVENLNPCHPILVGGISLEEEHVGYTQTKPIYAREIDNGRHQMLKFTPEHNHCLAMFWGPLAPPLTRIAVLQSNKGAFRIAAEAVVLDPKPDRKIMKESRQKGTPLKITERKALIKFELEDINVAEFIGAPIRTLDGIRGQVKEVAKREGIAKCTFKKRICMSDVVFMRMLRQAEAPRFFNSLSVPPEPREEQRRGVEIMDGDARPRIATTIALVRNKVGTYVAADGGAFDSLTNECIDENRDKIFEVCDNLFAAPSGCENWYKPIIKYCRSAVSTSIDSSIASH
ncbi:hypothetical protein MKX03_009102 [Papaver bracteatum]|nr:hypothetical protein MKX03_009102 [Papaver bracteatum]